MYLLCLMFSGNSIAQEQTHTKQIDSLLQVWNGMKNSRTVSAMKRVDVLYSLGAAYLFRSLDSSQQYYQEGLEIAEQKEFPLLIMQGYLALAYGLSNNGKYDEAFTYLVKAEVLSKKEKNDTIAMEVRHYMGNIHKRQGNFELAIESYEQARQQSLSLPYLEYSALISAVAAEVHLARGSFELVEQDARMALNVINKIRLQWKEKRFSPKYVETIAWVCLGTTYIGKERYDSAYLALQNARFILDDKLLFPLVYGRIALVFAYLGRIDSVRFYAREAQYLAETLQEQYTLQLTYKDISDANKILRNFELAYHYHDLLDKIKDEATRKQVAEKIAYFTKLQEQTRKKEEMQARRYFEVAIIVALLFVSMIAGMLFLRYRTIKRTEGVLQGMNHHLQTANAEIHHQMEKQAQQSNELEQMNEALQQQNVDLELLNQEKNELMDIVAHDLRNPLAAVMGMTEVLTVNENFVHGHGRVLVERIWQSSEQMMRIISRLVEVNNVASGRIQVKREECDIVAMLHTILGVYENAAQRKNIHLHFHPEKTIVPIQADAYMLYQVLDNIISNAIKYSPHQKNVWVRVLGWSGGQSSLAISDVLDENTHSPMTKPENLRIEVQDEGPGVSPDDMKKLFGKFARLSAQPTGGEHSSGLGLSIVKKMVEAMNGRVWCESNFGKGATFIVTLPSLFYQEKGKK